MLTPANVVKPVGRPGCGCFVILRKGKGERWDKTD